MPEKNADAIRAEIVDLREIIAEIEKQERFLENRLADVRRRKNEHRTRLDQLNVRWNNVVLHSSTATGGTAQ